jgi:hypothetical protein
MPVSSVQYGQQPWQYANGFKITNDGTTPDEIINIAAGSILDSTGVYQIIVDDTISIDITDSGLNGLDTGTVAASKVYAVYLVADPVTQQATGAIFSLSLTGPLLPFGYSAYALIGFVVTDSTSDILLGSWTAGNSTRRSFYFDAPIATAVTAGNATSYTAVSLAAFVPAVQDTPVSIAYAFTPGAAGRALNLTPGNGVGNAVTITGQVTSVVISGNAGVLSKVTSGVPEIDYKVANSGDAVALNVAGFDFFI